jgi:hypothetical protein
VRGSFRWSVVIGSKNTDTPAVWPGSAAGSLPLQPVSASRAGLSSAAAMAREEPLWKELPQIAFWLLPAGLGTPLILYALLKHPLAQRQRQTS